MHSEVPERMERMLRAWDRHLVHPALPRTLAARLRAAGFADVRCEAHAFCTTSLDPETYGGNLPGILTGFLRALPDVDADELAAWHAELKELDTRGAYYCAVMQCCFTATAPG